MNNTLGGSDPFNYPMPGRKDLMSLSTINQGDTAKVTTKQFTTSRYDSFNLQTKDIEGKLASVVIILRCFP